MTSTIREWWPLIVPLATVATVLLAFMNCAVAHLALSLAARLYDRRPTVRADKREEWLRVLTDMAPRERPGHAGSLLWTAALRRVRRQPSLAQVETVRGFRGAQVCEIIGVTYRQLDYWARTDLIRPSIVDSDKTGTRRLYSYADLLQAMVIKSLLDAGISLQSVRRSISHLRGDARDDLASATLLLGGRGPTIALGDDEVVEFVRKGQGVLNIVSLEGMKDEVDAAIKHLQP